jgi:hypothetical protein
MSKQFHHAGVAFTYPDGWKLEPEDHDDGWGLSLHSPATAFVSIRCHRSSPTIEELAETVLAILRAEYPGLEAEPRVESIAGQMALGHDMQFMTLDLTNTAWTRCFYTDAGTLLILGQTTDIDPEGSEAILRGILTSLRLEDLPDEPE